LAALLVVVGNGPTASSRLAKNAMARTLASDVWLAEAIIDDNPEILSSG